jgi:transposase
MASITRKKIRGRIYYYARECKRINGQPKIVWQKYLGRAEDIIRAVTQSSSTAPAAPPRKGMVIELGAVAALYDLSRRLRLMECIDRHVPKSGSGPSVGTYLLVAAINRCVAPCSKASIADWFQTTVLRRLLEIEARQLTSQRFWDHMDRVTPEAIEQIEADLVEHMVAEFQVDLARVLFDGTNFFTFIDTFNQRCTLAQRGKNKEGRSSLRIVGLALLVTTDSHLPLFHRTYAGNQPDAPTFSKLLSGLVERCRRVTQEAQEVTLIFDKGNNSQDNLAALADGPYHFIGSLVPTHHRELLEIPLSRFSSLDDEGLSGVLVYRTRKSVFGLQRTVLVTYNENLFVTQSQTLLREIAKRQLKLRELQQRLRRWRSGKIRGGRRPTVEGTRKKVKGWLKARHMKELFSVEISDSDGFPMIHYRFNHRAWQRLQTTLLGKTLLFTDLEDWSDVEILRGYRSQYQIESCFRTLKDPHHICLRPQYHWTDQKIEVHVFCCVLALMLVSLLQRELHQQGIDGSIPELLEQLGKIRQLAVVYPPPPGKRTPALHTTLTELSDRQQALFDALGLHRFLKA